MNITKLKKFKQGEVLEPPVESKFLYTEHGQGEHAIWPDGSVMLWKEWCELGRHMKYAMDACLPPSKPNVTGTSARELETPAPAQENKYQRAARELADLVTQKQAAYGDSFGKSGDIMRILYPDGIPVGGLDDALTIVRIVDKLFRIATDRDALGESPWGDIEGYALLARVRLEAESKLKDKKEE